MYAQAFLARNATNRRLTLDGDANKILMSYAWPGNVRELQNAVERLLASCQSDIVRAADVVSVLDAPSDATESAGTVDYDPRKSRSWAP